MTFEVMADSWMRRVQLGLEDLRLGKMVILTDDEDRENEGDLVMAADAVTPEAINFMATHGRGLICLTLTEERVAQLQLPMMVANNQSPYHTAFTVSIEAREGVSTGISVHDRAQTIRAAIDPSKGPQDLVTPGHIFPLRARDGGVLIRTGQTEGSVDLARLAGLTPSGVICEIMKEDGTMARLPDLLTFGEKHKIRILSVADLIRWRLHHERQVEEILCDDVTVRPYGRFTLRVFRSIIDNRLHIALTKGEIDDNPLPVRVQAANPAMDVFGFTDSRSRLASALELLSKEKKGVLLYLNISEGSTDAILASLQELFADVQGPKAKSAGPKGLRDLGTGAQILLELGVRKLRLMTNNPRKIVGLEGFGLRIVEYISLNLAKDECEEGLNQLSSAIQSATDLNSN
jgi:3,4-dihydroxy 2-butanone 4-phosphate synthase/GTP cyclohydrolase II